ncbi:GATA zinc finger domain-containing protein 10-like [Thrips palmi]|uniref:GATA zinc finger domain-containing protein 10-like n=1 Tax=Thrips palmi TaxID=161013 RepID=A0A6P8YKA7_THRPL|nr:GATA zinc finger domain-containing protein 10-like [Thrips palmi]
MTRQSSRARFPQPVASLSTTRTCSWHKHFQNRVKLVVKVIVHIDLSQSLNFQQKFLTVKEEILKKLAWTRLACALAALLVVLQAPRGSALRSVREKQVKLEDIERDNLQSELLKQRPLERPEGHPAYHQHQQQHQQQHQHQQEEREPEQAYHPQHYHHQQQHHYRFEQPAAPQQHHHLQQQQQHLLYQAAASAAPAAPIVPTHVMYLLMPNGNVAAFQIAPHPNHIQAYYTPSGKPHLQHQMSLGTLFHQHAPIPMAYLQPQLPSHQLQSHQLQPQLQQQVHQQVQYVPAALPAASAQSGQRYHPTVHHQPTLSFNSPQAHQLHAQHFRELSGEPSASHGAGPEVSTYSQPAEQPQQPQQPIQQSHKSLFGAGVKATASPPLKGSFSTQTGQSYANFRQYG